MTDQQNPDFNEDEGDVRRPGDENDSPFVPEGEAVGEGVETPLTDVPEDASSLLDPDAQAAAPTEASASERAAQGDEVARLQNELSERTTDLQRLHAEYVNYKKRVDRDRDVAKNNGVQSVVRDLLPVLDAIEAAKQQEAFDGGLKLVAESIERVVAKHGVETFGEVGEEFDPTLHEALMQVPMEGDHTTTVISSVMQKGVRIDDRVVRPARVGVAEPN